MVGRASITVLGGYPCGIAAEVFDSWGGVVSASVGSVVWGIMATIYLVYTDWGHVGPIETPVGPGV